MQKAPAPFSCQYSPNIPELLHQLQCTLVISTYQAGKLIFLSAKDENSLIQLPRTFNKAMGIALHNNKMAIATLDEIIILANSPQLAQHYPTQPNTYDALYMPRASYYTGQIDIHDLDWGEDEQLYAINTSFSCLIKIDDNYSFTPVWKPPFISNLASEDRCHLNGLAMKNGRPKFVTAFNNGDTPQSWRDKVERSGIIMDIETNETIAKNLPMPHSPRIFNNNLYLLFSATGELARINLDNGSHEVICQLNGFVRGMAKHGDYVFIGLSKLRQNSSSFAKLAIAKKARHAGIAVIHLPTGALVGEIRYQSSVDEIYDIQILPNMIRPGILNTAKPLFKMGLSTPEATYWAKSKPLNTKE